ncbi:copper chaperone PCu(A)C [Undibacterium sp. LX40W]|uniref:Copper chaperone PCu(A)C n=2 Tax=Oxalobacteraceae TaxID=75682 RepID=A0A923HLN8_9BURK|nr:copper chaperone PCu(A)C [Undibacterium nitidum]MBC3891163.1 copper chaperone PCu(A)C [Undibacterium sp. LX40W]
MMMSFGVAGVLGIVMMSQAMAQINVKNAWVRATVGPQKTTGAFLQIETKTEVSLVKVESKAAGMIEIHEMQMDGGVMKMREVDKVICPAGKVTELSPGGFHIMLMNLKKQAKEGDQIALILSFEDRQGKRQVVSVNATVKSMAASSTAMTMH